MRKSPVREGMTKRCYPKTWIKYVCRRCIKRFIVRYEKGEQVPLFSKCEQCGEESPAIALSEDRLKKYDDDELWKYLLLGSSQLSKESKKNLYDRLGITHEKHGNFHKEIVEAFDKRTSLNQAKTWIECMKIVEEMKHESK